MWTENRTKRTFGPNKLNYGCESGLKLTVRWRGGWGWRLPDSSWKCCWWRWDCRGFSSPLHFLHSNEQKLYNTHWSFCKKRFKVNVTDVFHHADVAHLCLGSQRLQLQLQLIQTRRLALLLQQILLPSLKSTWRRQTPIMLSDLIKLQEISSTFQACQVFPLEYFSVTLYFISVCKFLIISWKERRNLTLTGEVETEFNCSTCRYLLV